MRLSQPQAAKIALQTVMVLARGRYKRVSRQCVNIGVEVQAARQNTVEYSADASLASPARANLTTVFEVVNESTLAASKRLHDSGLRPVALNFASAVSPGGGFLIGARAQEESLCRNSALFACLRGRQFYRVHRKINALYTSHAIYSPDVPVIRDESGELLADPWPLAFITSAAPNARFLRSVGQYKEAVVAAAFEERIRKVLSIGAAHGHDSIVLGAWGCGAFGNKPADVAPIFGRILRDEFSGVFERVVFAVLDRSAEKRFIGAFEVEFVER